MLTTEERAVCLTAIETELERNARLVQNATDGVDRRLLMRRAELLRAAEKKLLHARIPKRDLVQTDAELVRIAQRAAAIRSAVIATGGQP